MLGKIEGRRRRGQQRMGYNAYWFAIIVISPVFGQGYIDTYTFSFSRLHIILLNLVSPF